MNSKILLVLTCLALGGALFWFLKPSSAPTTADGDPGKAKSARETSASPVDGIQGEESRPRSKGERALAEEKPGGPGDGTGLSSHMAETMVARQQQKFDREIAALTAKLDLDASQQAALRNYYREKLEALRALLHEGNSGDPEAMNAIAELMRGGGLEEVLTRVLTDEQYAAYQAKQTEDRNRQVASQASKDLATLNEAVSLQENQRDALYQLFREDADARYGQRSQSNAYLTITTDGVGINLEDNGFTDTIIENSTAAAEGGALTPEEMRTALWDAHRQKVDEQVARLSDILNPEQQQQYRDHLESGTSEFVENALTIYDSEAARQDSKPVLLFEPAK